MTDISKNDEIKKILIIRLSALGDTIHTIPLAFNLRKLCPDAQLDWIVEDKAQKFVAHNPLLNNVYILNKKKYNCFKFSAEFIKIIKKIRQEHYDIAIDTQQLFKSGIILGLSGAKRRITPDNGREFSFLFANEIINTNKKLFDINYHVVNRNLEAAKYLGCNNIAHEFIIPDFSNEYSQNIKNIMNSLDKSKKNIVLAPATTWKNKHWNVQGWANIIKEFQQDCHIILTASEKEKFLTDKILSYTKNPANIINLAGKTSLADLVYIYKNANLVVSPDSGSAHIAWACGNPKVLTLFFATSAKRTAPFGSKYYSISARSECSPCMKKHCRLPFNKNKCIDTINPADVVKIIKKVL